jgi:hypothetical protein
MLLFAVAAGSAWLTEGMLNKYKPFVSNKKFKI